MARSPNEQRLVLLIQIADVVWSVRAAFGEGLDWDYGQGGFVGGLQHDGGLDAIGVRLQPPTRAHTPSIPWLEPRESELRVRRGEVITDRLLMLEELGRYDGADGVRAKVIGTGVAVSVAVKAGQGFHAAHFQGFTEDVVLLHALTVDREPGHRQVRPNGVMRRAKTLPRFSGWSIAGAVVTAVALLLPASTAQAAANPLTQAKELRSDVLATTNQYIDRYEGRMTVEDQRELRSTARQTRVELDALVRAIRRAEARDTTRTWKAAVRQHSAAANLVDSRFDDVRSIIEPKLSFSEKLGAFADYSSAMRDFESLGAELSRRADK